MYNPTLKSYVFSLPTAMSKTFLVTTTGEDKTYMKF